MSQQKNTAAEEFAQNLIDKLPPVIARKAVGQFLGGAVAVKTLSNADASGRGPQGGYMVGRNVVYPTPSLVRWIVSELGVSRLRSNVKE